MNQNTEIWGSLVHTIAIFFVNEAKKHLSLQIVIRYSTYFNLRGVEAILI